jgi:hypothetical protein
MGGRLTPPPGRLTGRRIGGTGTGSFGVSISMTGGAVGGGVGVGVLVVGGGGVGGGVGTGEPVVGGDVGAGESGGEDDAGGEPPAVVGGAGASATGPRVAPPEPPEPPAPPVPPAGPFGVTAVGPPLAPGVPGEMRTVRRLGWSLRELGRVLAARLPSRRGACAAGAPAMLSWWGSMDAAGWRYMPRSTSTSWCKPVEKANRPAVPSAGRIEATPPALAPMLGEADCSAAKRRWGAAVANANQATERRAE